MLEGELDKIHDFQKAKVCLLPTLRRLSHKILSCPVQTTELSNRIKIAEKQVKKLVSDEFSTTPSTPSPTLRRVQQPAVPDSEDPEASRKRDSLEQDGGSDDDDSEDEGDTLATDDDSTQSLDALSEQFHFLEEEVANLVADVHDLALYTKLNITGFMKILKVPISLFSAFFRIHQGHLRVETRRTWPHPTHVCLFINPVHASCRSKPRLPLPRPLFRTTSRSALSISTTGTQSS